jgi:transposase
MEQLNYNMLFRWFVGLSMDDAVWDPTTFTKNRDRLLAGDIADAFFAELLSTIKTDGLLSAEHFTVDGTLLEGLGESEQLKPKTGADDPSDDPKKSHRQFS